MRRPPAIPFAVSPLLPALGVVLFAAAAPGSPVRACICSPAPPLVEYVTATAVFTAVPVGSAMRTIDRVDLREWTLQVRDVWKGSAQGHVRVSEYFLAGGGSFEVGVPVLIFADPVDSGYAEALYRLGRCGNPIVLSEADEILAELPRPLGDRTESDGSLLAAAADDLVRALRSEGDAMRRLRLWSALAGRVGVPLDGLLDAAEGELSRGASLSLDLAVRIVLDRPEPPASKIGFLREALRSAKTTRYAILAWVDTHRLDDPSTLAALREDILHRPDRLAVNVWLELGPDPERAGDLVRALLARADRDVDAGADADGEDEGMPDLAADLAAEIVIELGLQGDDLAAAFIAGLDEDGERPIDEADRALGTLGAVGVEPLMRHLTSAEEVDRWEAAMGLGLAGRAAEPAIGLLEIAAAGDPDEDVRYEAVVALERIRPGLGWSRYEVWKAGDEDARSTAVEFLLDLGGPKAIRELTELLGEPDVAEDAAMVLGWEGAEAADALPALRRAAADPDHPARETARDAVAQIEQALDGGD